VRLQTCGVGGRARGGIRVRDRDQPERLARASERLALVGAQMAAIEAAQAAARRAAPQASALGRMVQLKGIATTSASVLLDEGLVWRAFRNRRQLGGLLGFAPAKYESGDSSRDLGITRAGNKRLPAVMVQLAWGWCTGSARVRSRSGIRPGLGAANGPAKSALSHWRASCSSRSGAMSPTA
jgi:transposase